ncbi:hypothetical protein Rsub_02360 [Raphidocelis subcapitata]|uniref:USP domain-containing protein n=1 Tax=Raphidocelis subcapitata TaxID=307507 RepID=A0A2V0NSK4_9CHLO|nr:hypothetical protein Rsub_02360 [Raphidocelis subcapitata]|eukprot:GBF89642.1 hypothetical protein Rsub_02360 [Raphidocelis subcapitata]
MKLKDLFCCFGGTEGAVKADRSAQESGAEAAPAAQRAGGAADSAVRADGGAAGQRPPPGPAAPLPPPVSDDSVPPGGRGAENSTSRVKNLCYANALAQALASSPQAVALIRATREGGGGGTGRGAAVAGELRRAVEGLLERGACAPLSLDPLRSALDAFAPDGPFKRGAESCPVTTLDALMEAAADVAGACAARGRGRVACEGRGGACRAAVECAASAGRVVVNINRMDGPAFGVEAALRAGVRMPVQGAGVRICGDCRSTLDGTVPLDALGPVLFVQAPFTKVQSNDITAAELQVATAPGFFPEAFDAGAILSSGAPAVFSLRSIVCGLPNHFVALCRRGGEWLLVDDGKVLPLAGGGDFAAVLAAMAADRMRPVLALYDSPADAAARRRGGACGGGAEAAAAVAVSSSGNGSGSGGPTPTADWLQDWLEQLTVAASELEARAAAVGQREAAPEALLSPRAAALQCGAC